MKESLSKESFLVLSDEQKWHRYMLLKEIKDNLRAALDEALSENTTLRGKNSSKAVVISNKGQKIEKLGKKIAKRNKQLIQGGTQRHSKTNEVAERAFKIYWNVYTKENGKDEDGKKFGAKALLKRTEASSKKYIDIVSSATYTRWLTYLNKAWRLKPKNYDEFFKLVKEFGKN